MLKQTISYTDFNGQQVTEDLHFHLSTPDHVRLAAKYGGDLAEYLEKVAKSDDPVKMIAIIEEIIKAAYGEKSKDGKHFVKTPEIVEQFNYSQAYAELFESIILDPAKAEAFAAGVITPTDTKQAEAIKQRIKLEQLKQNAEEQ